MHEVSNSSVLELRSGKGENGVVEQGKNFGSPIPKWISSEKYMESRKNL